MQLVLYCLHPVAEDLSLSHRGTRTLESKIRDARSLRQLFKVGSSERLSTADSNRREKEKVCRGRL